MRSIPLFAALLAFFAATTLFAEPLSEGEKEAVKAAVMRRLEVTPKRMENEALSKVFGATFYTTELRLDLGGGRATMMDIVLARVGEEFQHLPSPSTTQPVPELLALLHPAFRLKSKDDALVFEKALDELYPMSTFEQKHKAIHQKERAWTFVRGKFFKDKSGLVVTTDESGKITEIRNVLKLTLPQ